MPGGYFAYFDPEDAEKITRHSWRKISNVMIKGKLHTVGFFKYKAEAARAYDKFVISKYKGLAVTNFNNPLKGAEK